MISRVDSHLGLGAPLDQAGRWLRTVRHLRPVQIYGRIRSRIRKPSVSNCPSPPRRELRSELVSGPQLPPCQFGPSTIEFAGNTVSVHSPRDWSSEAVDHLMLYNLHYFDDLTRQGSSERESWHRPLLERWIRENPPNSKPGWDPYPTSLRLVNIIKWLIAGADTSKEILESLALQARVLSQSVEYHLSGNHLLVNAKALIFAGCFFCGEEAEQWKALGFEILSTEIPEQILQDGAHYERSPMYHALVLEDFLDLIAVLRSFDLSVPKVLSHKIEAMLGWLEAMTHPDGDIALFNDAAIDIAPKSELLFDYARRLGFNTPTDVPVGKKAESGYARLEAGDAVAIADFAALGPNHLPAHGHADSLSFELSLLGKRVFVNSGTSRYDVGPERHRQRSTSAHNTLTIDNENSSEVWSSFRVGRRAAVSNVSVTPTTASGTHDGYSHLPGSPVHKRSFEITETGLSITDTISGEGTHKIGLYFHLSPEIAANLSGASRVQLEGGDLPPMTLDSSYPVTLEASSYHPRFGSSLKNTRIEGHIETALPVSLTTEIRWA